MNDVEAASSFFAHTPATLGDELLGGPLPASQRRLGEADTTAALPRSFEALFPHLCRPPVQQHAGRVQGSGRSGNVGQEKTSSGNQSVVEPPLRTIEDITALLRADGSVGDPPPRAAAIATLYERTLPAALQILSQGPGQVAVLFTRVSERTVYRVGEHHCLGAWHCDCSAFRYQVVNKQEAYFCKHILVLHLCGAVSSNGHAGAFRRIPDTLRAEITAAEDAEIARRRSQEAAGAAGGSAPPPPSNLTTQHRDTHPPSPLVQQTASSTTSGNGAGAPSTLLGDDEFVYVRPVVDRCVTWLCVPEQDMTKILAGTPATGGDTTPPKR